MSTMNQKAIKKIKRKDDKNDKFIEEEDDNYPDVPSPSYIEEGVEKYDNVTTPDSMDRGRAEENMKKMKQKMMKERQKNPFTLLLLIWRNVQVKK